MDLGTTQETIPEVIPENIIEVVPETILETRSFSNIVFIDQSVSDYTLFLNNVNDVTLPIVYHSSTTREEILSLLTDFSHFDRIAFVFHGIYPGCYYDKSFLENQPYFTLDGSGNVVVTENVSFIQTILSTFTVSHVDFLGCNLLLSKEWRDYFDLLGGFGGIVVGASNDNTGNLKYGGDWILENTMEDVRNVYFSSGLDNYSGLLIAQTSITGNVTLTQDGSGLIDNTGNTYAWTNAILITGNNITVTFGGSIRISSINHYFQINGNNVTVDGGNNIVSISATDYTGLFAFNGQNLENIKNIIIRTETGATIATIASSAIKHSWFCNGLEIWNFPTVWNVMNCGMTGNVGLTNGAGFTPNTRNLNTCNFYNCYNTTEIVSPGTGGIVGAANSGTISLYNCWNSGNINADSAGGLIGQNTLSIIKIIHCYNKGNILSMNSGGLVGDQFGKSQSSASLVSNCYNIGSVSQSTSGGFFGGSNYGFGQSASFTVTISNCYNAGQVLGTASAFTPTIANNFAGIIFFYNCYSISGSFIRVTNSKTIIYRNNYNVNGGTWSDSAANATGNLINTPSSVFSPGTVWTSIAANTPYLLSSFVGNIYSSSGTTSASSFASPSAIPSGYTYNLLSMNSTDPSTYGGTINSSTGIITFASLPKIKLTMNNYVLAYNLINGQYVDYFFGTFVLYITNPSTYDLNRYYLTFYTYSASNPTVLTRSIYDNNKVLQSSFDISFGGQNVQTVLSLLDSGSGPYTLGLVDTNGNSVATDVAFCGLYSKALTTTQVQKLMTYVNTFKEPHTSATVYTVTVSGGVFNLNGTPQPNITFTSGLYVFDQSSSTNVGNTLVLGTTLDVFSSVVTNNVVYSGTAGTLNAYTLIDFSGSNPAPLNVYYFSSTTMGMGYLQIPSFTNMVLWLDASNVSLANNTAITTTNIDDKSPNPKSLLSVPGVTFQTDGLKTGYPGFAIVNNNSGMNFTMPINTFLSSSSPQVGGMTVFFVCKLSSGRTSSLISTTQSFFDFYGFRRIFYSGSSNQYTNAPYFDYMNNPSIYYFTINVTSSGTTMSETLYTSNYNGTNYSTSPLTFTGTTNAPNGNYDTYGKISIGNRFQPNGSADNFGVGGAISEVIIYNTKLETAKITQIVGYLRTKWNI